VVGGKGKIENVKLAGKQAIRENNINRPGDCIEANVVGSKNNNNNNNKNVRRPPPLIAPPRALVPKPHTTVGNDNN